MCPCHSYCNYTNCCHTGKDNSLDTSNVGATHAVVLKLVEGLEGRGHHVYTDNYYSSPALFGDLRRLGFGACGTVRVNRQGMPKEMKAGLKKGDSMSRQIDTTMMALKWMDKRPVTMLTTIHDDSFVTKRRRSRAVEGGQEDILKPKVVEEYNKYMGGVDTGDQLESYYGFSHRTLKWWRRLFFHLIEMAVVNAYILYLLTPCTGKRMTHAQFRVELAKGMLMESTTATDEPPRGPHPDPNPPSHRLTGRHFPGRLGPTASGRQNRPDCIVCSRKKGRGRKATTYECKQCSLPMCVVPCFELYHTKTNPERYL